MTLIGGELGYTHNLGNFKSVKGSVTINEESVREGETVDEAYDRIFKKIEDQLVARITSLIKELEAVDTL